MRLRLARMFVICPLIGVALIFPGRALALDEEVPVPPPEAGSFFTVFDYLRDGRLVTFDGFTVFIQESRRQDAFEPIGTLPDEYRGATDPALLAVSPNGRRILLGAGGGGSRFPDPRFNGNIFEMPITGGTAELVGTFPFSILGTFYRKSNDHLLFTQSEGTGTSAGSVQLLDLRTRLTRPIIDDVPGIPDGVAVDQKGDVYVGLGIGADPERTGEIRRFAGHLVRQAIKSGQALGFDAAGTFVTEVLNGGDLEFDRAGDLFVSGADFAEQDLGYVAKVDVSTGEVVDRFDPADGDPDDGDQGVYAIEITPRGCTLGALDLNAFFTAEPEVIFQRDVCGR